MVGDVLRIMEKVSDKTRRRADGGLELLEKPRVEVISPMSAFQVSLHSLPRAAMALWSEVWRAIAFHVSFVYCLRDIESRWRTDAL